MATTITQEYLITELHPKLSQLVQMHLLKDEQPLICIITRHISEHATDIIGIGTSRQMVVIEVVLDKGSSPKSGYAWESKAILLSEVVSTEASHIRLQVTVSAVASGSVKVNCYFDTDETALKFYNILLETIARAKVQNQTGNR